MQVAGYSGLTAARSYEGANHVLSPCFESNSTPALARPFATIIPVMTTVFEESI